MKLDKAEQIARRHGIDLTHKCDGGAPECDRLPTDDAPNGHAHGDVRCSNRQQHSACIHDLVALAQLRLVGKD